MFSSEKFLVRCKHCGKDNIFDQPYPYHAGFTDQGFLYNDTGTLTLVWSMLDPVLIDLFSQKTLWTLNSSDRRQFEKRLHPAPIGGCWRFKNPARCAYCAKPISKPMLRSIHYLVYPGSILTDKGSQFRLRDYLDLSQ
jgi:hypothetical protein